MLYVYVLHMYTPAFKILYENNQCHIGGSQIFK